MRIYMDNCCYNRPFDSQEQIRIRLEAEAKLYVQELVKTGAIELASSYIETYENWRNPFEGKRSAIDRFLRDNVSVYVDNSFSKVLDELAGYIMATGIKTADAHHVAAAIIAKCDYLLTTDDRLLKYTDERIKIVTPPQFIAAISLGMEQQKEEKPDENDGNGGHEDV